MTESVESKAPNGASNEVAQEINWGDYRDHLATADWEGRRRWIFPKRPSGAFYRARTYVSWLLLAILFAGPFIRVNGNPLLMINVVERKFVILGQIFWPQDTVIFAMAMLVFLTGIVAFTAAFGRLWCGWTCPQTLLMEMVFRKIEYWIEGDASQQRALGVAPWSSGKIVKKLTKHGIFFGLSFVIGNTLLAYIIGSGQLFLIITDHPMNHLTGLSFMLIFTLVFYAIFARFREQACTFICPYGRFQSTLLDTNSIVVAYDYKRGESRGRLRGRESQETRRSSGLGDCVDCRQCVVVCPTGIDIRNGTQMECVNCTACIDACDSVMRKIARPTGLIRYASTNGIERGERLKMTPRIIAYSAVLVVLIGVFLTLVWTRGEIETSLLRAPGALYQTMPNGNLSNLYTLNLANKTSQEIPVELRLENVRGTIKVIGADLRVPAEELAKTSILVELAPEAVTSDKMGLTVGVYSGGRQLEAVKTVFIGPSPARPAKNE